MEILLEILLALFGCYIVIEITLTILMIIFLNRMARQSNDCGRK